MVKKKNAVPPAITESDSRVNNTFIATLPQRIVVNKKLKSLRSANIFMAAGFFAEASTSSRSRLIPSNARFNPENMADCEIQNRIPGQTSHSIDIDSVMVNFSHILFIKSAWNQVRASLNIQAITDDRQYTAII